MSITRCCPHGGGAVWKKYAIHAVLAIVARQQKGQVTVFTSEVDDLERLVPESVVVRKV